MSSEKLKVLELVSEGKITPEDGVRLIEALGEADRKSAGGSNQSFGGQKINPFGLGEIRIPKIDLGNLGEVLVEVKNNAVDFGKKAEAGLKRSRAGRFFEMQDYPLSAPRSGDISRARVKLELRAGKLRLRAAEAGSSEFISGSVKRSPEEPTLVSEAREGQLEASVKCSLGRAVLNLHPDLHYRLSLVNAAADARLELTDLAVEELTLDNNAGNVSIDIGERVERVSLKADNNAGSLRCSIPAHYALRVSCSGTLSSHNLEKYGLELQDGQAQSGDWNDNPRGVDIKLNQNVASFQLEWQRRDGVSVGYNPVKDRVDESEWREED